MNLEGAKAAAPIWAEFMNRAIQLPQYSDMHDFTKPDGVTNVRIDRATNLPADSSCPADYTVAFLDGTIPNGTCSQMSNTGQAIVNGMPTTANTPDSTDPARPKCRPEEAESVQAAVRAAVNAPPAVAV